MEVWIENLQKDLLLICQEPAGRSYRTQLTLHPGEFISPPDFRRHSKSKTSWEARRNVSSFNAFAFTARTTANGSLANRSETTDTDASLFVKISVPLRMPDGSTISVSPQTLSPTGGVPTC